MNLTAPAMVIAGLSVVVWLGLYLVGLGRRWGVLVPFALMLLASALSLPVDWMNRVLPTAWLPIQQRRSLIFLVGGLFALFMVVVHFRNLRGKSVSMLLVTLVMMGFYSSLLRLHHDGMSEGFQSILYSFATLIPLALVVPIAVSEPEDFKPVLRALAIVNAAWIGMCLLQMVANVSFMTLGKQGRFVGMMSNPQHTGAFLAFMIMTVLWLTLNDQKHSLRFIYIALLGVNLVMLVWTGSRTGLGMAVIGCGAVLYTRIGRAALLLPVALIFAYAAFKVLVSITGLDIGAERLASAENTRSYAWWKLYTTGMENPLFGAGLVEAEKSENSWLYAFAAFGVGMLFFALMVTLIGIWQCLRAARVRGSLPAEHRRMLDLCVGAIAMYFAGAVLEGYMVSRVNPSLCFIMIYSNMAVFMIRSAALGRVYGSGIDELDGYAIDEDGVETGRYSVLGPVG
jgi:hypothetical protein